MLRRTALGLLLTLLSVSCGVLAVWCSVMVGGALKFAVSPQPLHGGEALLPIAGAVACAIWASLLGISGAIAVYSPRNLGVWWRYTLRGVFALGIVMSILVVVLMLILD